MVMAKTKRQMIVKVQFNRNFQTYNTTRKRYRLAKGSAGSGKSVNTAQDFIIKLGDPKYKGANLLCVRKVAVILVTLSYLLRSQYIVIAFWCQKLNNHFFSFLLSFSFSSIFLNRISRSFRFIC